jgi:hypothetical protein
MGEVRLAILPYGKEVDEAQKVDSERRCEDQE